MIWAYFEPSSYFLDLADRVALAVRQIHDFSPDNNERIIHLTLARFKEINNHELKLPNRSDFHRLPVLNIDLMSSELTSEGPIHSLIRRFPLMGV